MKDFDFDSLYPEADIIVIPAFRESAENTTLGYTVIRAEKRISSEPLYLFYFSDSEFRNAHYQSVRPATDNNILRSLSQDGTFPIQDPSFQFPDGSQVSSQYIRYVYND